VRLVVPRDESPDRARDESIVADLLSPLGWLVRDADPQPAGIVGWLLLAGAGAAAPPGKPRTATHA